MRKSFAFLLVSGLFVSANVSAQGCEPGKQCQSQQAAPSGHSHQSSHSKASSKKQVKSSSHHQAQNKKVKTISQSHHGGSAKQKQKVYKHPSAKSKGTYYVSANRLNVRGAPGKAGKVKGHFNKGQALAVYAVVDGWAKVYFNGQYLWVSNQYLHIKL